MLDSRCRASEADRVWSGGAHGRTLRFSSSSAAPSRSFILGSVAGPDGKNGE